MLDVGLSGSELSHVCPASRPRELPLYITHEWAESVGVPLDYYINMLKSPFLLVKSAKSIVFAN